MDEISDICKSTASHMSFLVQIMKMTGEYLHLLGRLVLDVSGNVAE